MNYNTALYSKLRSTKILTWCASSLSALSPLPTTSLNPILAVIKSSTRILPSPNATSTSSKSLLPKQQLPVNVRSRNKNADTSSPNRPSIRATSTTRPLTPVLATAASSVRCVPAQSIATCTPRPLLASLTAEGTSDERGLRTRSAPQAVAMAARAGEGSETATKEAPLALRTLRWRNRLRVS